MASSLDSFPNLPGIIHELQDGNIQITQTSSSPVVLVLGTAAEGPSMTSVQVNRANESQALFGTEGTLIKGMYEAIDGGGENIYLLRIGAKNTSIFGVGTDDQVANPTEISPLMKDGSAADLYLIRYIPPVSPAVLGQLLIKDSAGIIVYNSNPGGAPLTNGEVVVSGLFNGTVRIGDALDPDDYYSIREVGEGVASNSVLNFPAGTFVGRKDNDFDLGHPDVTLTEVRSNGAPLSPTDYNLVAGAGTGGVDRLTILATTNDQIVPDGATIEADYTYITVSTQAPASVGMYVGGAGDETFDLSHADVQSSTLVVTSGVTPLVTPRDYNLVVGGGTGGVDQITIVATGIATGGSMITVGYSYDVTNSVPTYTAGLYVGREDNEFDLGNNNIKANTLIVKSAGLVLNSSNYTLTAGAGTGGVDLLTVLATSASNTGQAITADYTYTLAAPTTQAASSVTFVDGDDGLSMSKMELYEVLDRVYSNLESSEIDIIAPKGIHLDSLNLADGTTITLPGVNEYPVKDSIYDALGYMYKEEFEGEMYYFWNTNRTTPTAAQIWPEGVGAASSTTKIDGTSFAATDFVEVNFAYQLANFAFSLSVNDNECTAVVSTLGPKSNSPKDVANWVGKEPVVNALGATIANGTGLLGNKWMAGTTTRQKGFYATYSGNLPIGSNFSVNADIIKDRNGFMIDIGKYLSVTAFNLTYFNPTDTSGLGYPGGMETFYAGFYSGLAPQNSPLNKIISNATSYYRLSKSKLNALAKMKYVSVKVKEGTLRISDAPTAATDKSDYQRLTTVRIIADVVDSARGVAEPYIGGPNTAPIRAAMETGIIRELSLKQEAGIIQSFEVKISATTAQQISGDALMELIIVPAYELRKITIITSIGR